MTKTTSRFSLAVGVAMLAGTVVLAGCGGPSATRTSSTEQTTTSTPAPVVSTTSTTTQQTNQP